MEIQIRDHGNTADSHYKEGEATTNSSATKHLMTPCICSNRRWALMLAYWAVPTHFVTFSVWLYLPDFPLSLYFLVNLKSIISDNSERDGSQHVIVSVAALYHTGESEHLLNPNIHSA